MTVNLRATLNLHGSNFVVKPAHGLQGGVIITHLELTSHHVLHLKDDHAGVLVVLCKREKKEVSVEFENTLMSANGRYSVLC